MHCRVSTTIAALGLIACLLPVGRANATPSFARQTGFSCSQCHTQFPELTPFGRIFKATGYTMSTTKSIHQDNSEDRSVLDLLTAPPLGMMAQVSYTHTNTPTNPAFNDDIQFPQQVSIFYAGKIAPMLGAFMQLTYSGADNSFGMDNTDIRFAQTTTIADTTLIYGLSLNNNPSVQDLWNTTPAWGFPWAGSSSALTPSTAQPLISGGLAQQVAGLSAYGFWNNLVYAEISLYHSAPLGVKRPLGTPLADANGAATTTTDATNIVAGVAPYWRLTLEKDIDEHSFSLGTYGMAAKLYPGGATLLSGATNRYIDTAIDAQYQYLGEKHVLSVLGTWIHENSFLDATAQLGGVSQSHQVLNTLRVTAGGIYDHLVGVHLSYFSMDGTTDQTLYGPAAITGSTSGNPFSNGLLAEVSYTPWVNTKFSAQYIAYFNFNGASSNYDGAGRDASANNTLYLLAWLAY